ncbi:ferredoxin [Streptomyces regensis]|uniref:Ferredoxin n=1 Tax=Streptomyces flaveolus TaxID=67297 RepID=A0ABV3ACJ2_9ACTN|nr:MULTISPECIES: ferredoxin [Streptomyces]KMS82893.1 ferredoxin [Streptomyces regensis]KOG60271.1 ferredoxin [Streptomyces antibioticus]KOV72266.1 ferredoxin [Streptomyces sp. NRRL WC-3723]MBG7697930.1 ferredoxin [Streptomyces sp. MC1]
MRVTADRDRCVGSGQCAMLSPEVFDQDDDGLVLVLREVPGADLHEEVHRAADLCPAQSLRVHD